MNQLVADATTLALLQQAGRLAEVRDPHGNVIGYFAPISSPEVVRELRSFAMIDRDEIARRKANPGPGYSLEQVFEHLMTLTTNPDDQADLRARIAQLEESD
jgi:hypothetical protein